MPTSKEALLRTLDLRLKVWNLSSDTIARYRATVSEFISTVGAKPAYTKADYEAFMEALVARGAGGTYRRYVYSCLKTFYKVLGSKLELEKGEKPKTDEPTRRWYRYEEIVRILDAAKSDTDPRDWLMIRIWALTMGRRKSASLLNRTDYDHRAGVLTMPSIKGSGRYPVELDPETKETLDRYLLHRTDQYLALLPSAKPAGRKGHLHPHSLNEVLKRACRKARVEYKGVHAFRRGMATYYHRQGLDLRQIMALGPWKNEKQALAYIQLDPGYTGVTRKEMHPFFAKELNLEIKPSELAKAAP